MFRRLILCFEACFRKSATVTTDEELHICIYRTQKYDAVVDKITTYSVKYFAKYFLKCFSKYFLKYFLKYFFEILFDFFLKYFLKYSGKYNGIWNTSFIKYRHMGTRSQLQMRYIIGYFQSDHCLQHHPMQASRIQSGSRPIGIHVNEHT